MAMINVCRRGHIRRQAQTSAESGESRYEVGKASRPLLSSKRTALLLFMKWQAKRFSNADDSNYVRVQVLTPINVLNREKQIGLVRELTDIDGAAAGDPTVVSRIRVLIAEAPEGGWGINGHANTGAEIVAAARAKREIQSELKILENTIRYLS